MDVKLKCKVCGVVSELQVSTKNQLVSRLKKDGRCRQPFGPQGDTCRGELEVMEPEAWRDA